MAIEVFNRYENKYLLDSDTCRLLQRTLEEHMQPDDYNLQSETYTITNLYYDTPDDGLIRSSLQKPKYKQKLRMRAYGVPEWGDMVYVEIKKKVNGMVNKRRSAMTLDEGYQFLETGRMPDARPEQNRQVLSEISYLLQIYNLHPALYLAYDRRAYFSPDRDLRISFDRGIRTRRTALWLEKGDEGTPLLAEGQWLMEVKSSRSIPIWLSRTLSELGLLPTSFSKYGAEYKRRVEKARLWAAFSPIVTPQPSAVRPAWKAGWNAHA